VCENEALRVMLKKELDQNSQMFEEKMQRIREKMQRLREHQREEMQRIRKRRQVSETEIEEFANIAEFIEENAAK